MTAAGGMNEEGGHGTPLGIQWTKQRRHNAFKWWCCRTWFLYIPLGICLLAFAWSTRVHDETHGKWRFTHVGIGMGLCGLCCFGLMNTGSSRLNEHSLRRRMREEWIQAAAMKGSSTLWPHLSIDSTGGLGVRPTGTPEGSPWREALDLGFNLAGVQTLLRFTSPFVKLIIHVMSCYTLLVHAQTRHFDDPLDFPLQVTAWLDAGGVLLYVLCALLSLIGCFEFTVNQAPTRPLQFWCGIRAADSFSSIKLLTCTNIVEQVSDAADNVYRNVRNHGELGKSRSYIIRSSLWSSIKHSIKIFGGACVGVFALIIKIEQLKFLTEHSVQHWSITDFAVLIGFANTLMSMKDPEEAKMNLLAEVLQNDVDKEYVAKSFAGTRVCAWRKALQSEIMQEWRFRGLIVASTLRASDMAKLLINVKSPAVGDTVMATPCCPVPPHTTGVLERIKPEPIVSWSHRAIPRRVEISFESFKSEFELRSMSRPEVECSKWPPMPFYEEVRPTLWQLNNAESDVPWVLVPWAYMEIVEANQWALGPKTKMVEGEGRKRHILRNVQFKQTGKYLLSPSDDGQWLIRKSRRSWRSCGFRSTQWLRLNMSCVALEAYGTEEARWCARLTQLEWFGGDAPVMQ